ncbi:hypothetical protein TJA_15630 [Thermus sp. LT1-2-5]|uniref:sensor histidine kinase n=1 Tax=Thermus sp. LT1-2-5 TaxID=3026935 RepID=UPI0030EA8FF0
MVRALLAPFLVLLLGLGLLEAIRANGYLGQALLAEARRVAGAQAGDTSLSLLGVRLTDRPGSPLPLFGEKAEGVEVRPRELRAWVSWPWGSGALEVVRSHPLYLPAWGPALLLALASLLWARARVYGALRRALGWPLGEARRRLAALEAALVALEEGVAVVQGESVVLINPRARDLLGLAPEALTPISLRRIWPALADALALSAGEDALPLPTGRPARVRVRWVGEHRVVVFQDQRELLRLAENLTQSRRHLDLLRAQAHEFHNLLHVMAGLLELGRVEEALRLIQSEAEAEAELEQVLSRVEVPLLAALLLGKRRRAHELGVALALEGRLPARYAPLAEVLLSAVGHLVDNALEAAGPGGVVRVCFQQEASGLRLEVRDNGAGLPPGTEALFLPGASGRGEGRGYGLALVRAQVRSVGGELGYHREEGWTVFWIRLAGPWSGPLS